MAEKSTPAPVNTTVAGVKVSNPAVVPQPASAGAPVVKTGAAVHGQVTGVAVVIDNPA